jgi:phage protein D
VQTQSEPRASSVRAAALAIGIALGVFGAAALAGGSEAAASPGQAELSQRAPIRFAQAGASDEDSEVTSADVEKYIKVYKNMQHHHSLTVEQAASQEGLTVTAFRNLESRIERDDALRERVRKALRDSAGSSH